MAEVFSPQKLYRRNFGKIERFIEISNLIEMQKESYQRFLQNHVPPEAREDYGLQGVFKSVFPIWDFSGTASLEFVSYSFADPKYDVEECLQRGMTYEAPMKLTVRLVVYEVDQETGARSIRDIKEQEIYFGTIPLMTDHGTFIINGTERVVVSQLHRSPGLYIDHDRGKTHSSGKLLYSARLIPMRGSWIDLEFDHKDILYVRIDRRRKFPVTVLLKALGYSTEELLNIFFQTEKIYLEGETCRRKFIPDFLLNKKAVSDIVDPRTGEVMVKKLKKVTPASIRKMQEAGVEYLSGTSAELINRVVAHDILDPQSGEVLVPCNDYITEEKLDLLRQRGVQELDLLYIDGLNVSPCLRDTLAVDKTSNMREAILEIYKRLRPGNPPTLEVALNFFQNLFFKPEYYDLSPVGRLKLNLRLKRDLPLTHTTLTREDILYAVKELITQKDQEGPVDDIDHLGNRRVRAVGELLENQYRIGLVRMERAIRERMSLQDIDTLMPHDMINAKPVSAVVKEFFGTSQLSQFMDQTNPLSEITHKRRLSALGPGGLTRERAGFEVRDVHPTHYGRICPIETPEGPNIGLIVSLSTYARVNEFGFIETPYRVVEKKEVNGRVEPHVTKEVLYLSALDEGEHVIAQANAPLDSEGRFVSDLVSARKAGEFVMVHPKEVDFMDVSPNQLVSVASSLIPFLENDDANRALMGSNMQRQAVPLLTCNSPVIGTGMEGVVARDSGVTIIARRSGIVEDVDASRIVVRADNGGPEESNSLVDIYKLIKFQRTNQNTCFNQRPIVRRGERVEKGQIIADGPATAAGELALGKNVMVAFMPWGGYNFEDSILVSERIAKEDVYTSIHIEEFEILARDTKLGKEEITRDIPNVGEDALRNLDESGIIRIGAEVKTGDILVGKITPRGETQLSPEEKLLRAIFGEKAGDVRDTSLRVPPGIEGVIIDARVFSRKGIEKDSRSRSIEDEAVAKLQKDQGDELAILTHSFTHKLSDLLTGQKVESALEDERQGTVILEAGGEVTSELVAQLPMEYWRHISFAKPGIEEQVDKLLDNYQEQLHLVNMIFEDKIERLRKVDELPPGVIKMVKVFVALKRKLAVGDKMAGRHGNKGVVSRILPVEDMPYFEDGTPVDIVLNPLGVPSRMNVGQVLETHLGWASQALGHQIGRMIDQFYQLDAIKNRLKRIYQNPAMDAWLENATHDDLRELWERYYKEGIYMATPVFDGATEEEIQTCLKEAGVPEVGKAKLFDGRTGEPFDREVTVGIMYMMKLHHLVDDKIHARSIGPYSLVTQQPLGGKAQFGGQRLGEMEVWAMEAYGAAYSLQEFLTVKSDDVAGRTRMYEKIAKGQYDLEAGLPESFNVLVRELQSLALNIELLEDQEQKGTESDE
ncbi:MAG: DNA-directed RNA polymerase subunit beta [Deltaproteobacteria bacterium]|nr:DNA-directed RNA polymerase subunit beta [Deltaproteobacteria bacterium]MBW1987382.1 DNA-directed RNA polymerase subunit beta [Deltaproteobacteria bacterium]MBW2135530.1 DNA-directed RNA polymerase subunit beta [Deltaproteobacteria bacterium]